MIVTSFDHLGTGLAETIGSRELLLDGRNDLLPTSSPLENLANCIWRRLMTPLGFYPDYPDYGSELQNLIGLGLVPEVVSLAEIFVTQALVKEPRINKVERVYVVPTDYRALAIGISLRPEGLPNIYMMTFDYFLG